MGDPGGGHGAGTTTGADAAPTPGAKYTNPPVCGGSVWRADDGAAGERGYGATGVARPKRVASAIKVEPKVWFANERSASPRPHPRASAR